LLFFFFTNPQPQTPAWCAASAQHKPLLCIWASLAAHRKRKACSWVLKKPRRLYASDTLGCFGARPGGSCSAVTATSFAAPWLTSARLGSFARQVSQRTRPFSSAVENRRRFSTVNFSPESECIRADKCATRPSPITTRTPWVGPLTPCCHSLRPVGYAALSRIVWPDF